MDAQQDQDFMAEQRRGYRMERRARARLGVTRSTAFRRNRKMLEERRANVQNNRHVNNIPVEADVDQNIIMQDLNDQAVEREGINLMMEANETDHESNVSEEEVHEQHQNDYTIFAEALVQQQVVPDVDDNIMMPPLTVGPRNIQADEKLEADLGPNIGRTKFETLLLVLNFAMRHGLTAVAVEDLCKMINVILDRNVIPTTRHVFKKVFMSDMELKYHMYCPECRAYIGLITQAMKNLRFVLCPLCRNQSEVPGLNGKDFFVTLPVKTQIADLLQNMDDVLDQLNYRWERDSAGNIEDVFDGEVYKNLSKEGGFLSHKYNLSLTFSTNGASVFESGCTTMWPIIFRLNELKPDCRFDEANSMVAGLWFGKEEPSVAMYLRAFLHECKDLYDNGIYWQAPNNQVIHSKIMALNCVTDSVAKPMLQGVKQFNGFQSCPYCDHPGVTYGDSNMTKWPMMDDFALNADCGFLYTVDKYDKDSDEFVTHQVQDRDDESLREDMMIAEQRRAVEANFNGYKGVKGISPMCYLPFFDVCAGFQIDYMHAVLLGTCKHVASLWFDSYYRVEDYYIRESLAEIDRRLLAIKPPSIISRRPRSITQRCDWNANEWRSWLLYYSLPCLKGLLPAKFLKHHCILVSAIHIFLKSSISQQELVQATWHLGQYVHEFQYLYSCNHMYFNIHLLLHLGKSVRLWGPLFCFSMFSFESSNNTLIKLVKGTTGVASQIVSNYSVSKFLPHLLKVYDISQPVSDFCSDLLSYKNFSRASKHGDTTLVGAQKFIEPNNEERRAFLSHGLRPCGEFFERMIRKKVLYTARLYSRKGTKSDDSVICLQDGTYAAIIRIIKRLDGEVTLLLRKINTQRGFITLHTCGSKAQHIKLCQPIVYDQLFFASAEAVVGQLIYIQCGDTNYTAEFPNRIEND